MQVSVCFARFPWHAGEHPDVTDWLLKTAIKVKADPRVSQVFNFRVDDTPITMGRNQAIEHALRHKVDYLCMIDSDMSPDLPGPGAKPFWDSSFDFMLNHHGPCCVAAPYCGPPPYSNVYVFRWANWQNRDVNPNPDMRLEQYGREEAAERAGIERVGALPTGLILIDMRAIKKLKPPYFYYQWADEREMKKASTEDVTFTRDLNLLGVPQYCNWDAWAAHWKLVRVDKPRPIYADHVEKSYREAVLADVRSNERLVFLQEGNGVKD